MTVLRSQARSDFILRLLIACTGLIILWAIHSVLSEILQARTALPSYGGSGAATY